jgi:2-oxoglutarate dehydrogenase E1 component
MVTIEELLPFPSEQLGRTLAELNNKAKMVWVQEEPENAGAYRHVYFHLKRLGKELHYVGRPAIPSVAVGYGKRHNQEG